MTAIGIVSALGGDRGSIEEFDPRLCMPATATSSDGSAVEGVAKVISGISVIGEARNALDAAGWPATIAANRISVGEEVLAQLIPAKVGTFGRIDARWVVYSIVGDHPVWIVGAEQPLTATHR